jgi:hypothetical protein
MAYQVTNITALTQIPAIVATFAAARGWTVAGSVYTHESIPGALPMTLSASTTEVSWSGSGTPRAIFTSPNLFPANPTPQKLHLFGTQDYLAIVVEFSLNTYRHLYFGYLDKIGTFTGGECLGATSPQSSTSSRQVFSETVHQFLFNGIQTRRVAADSGGVRIVHPNNAIPWRFFRSSSLADYAVGGFSDGLNDQEVASGFAPQLGKVVLSPINLYCPKLPGSDTLAPVGAPQGVRHVNMRDIVPGAQVLVGGTNYRVFPAFSKRVELIPGTPTPTPNFPTFETSYYLGYAYREN